jgi:hypothetical protein
MSRPLRGVTRRARRRGLRVERSQCAVTHWFEWTYKGSGESSEQLLRQVTSPEGLE